MNFILNKKKILLILNEMRDLSVMTMSLLKMLSTKKSCMEVADPWIGKVNVLRRVS